MTRAAAAPITSRVSWIRDNNDPARRLTFYLGAHHANWLETSPVPLFISRNTFMRYSLDRDGMPSGHMLYAIDSGGFTELQQHGTWTTDPDEFGGSIYRIMGRVGPPTFCAPQDWMCEDVIIRGGTFKGVTFKGTGLDVLTHQEFTLDNYRYLCREFPAAPWIPVLQGKTPEDYLRHVDMYARAGIDLRAEDLVGLGSVCRRQATREIGLLVQTLAGMGLKLHGFGVKRDGLLAYGRHLASADSLAWSFGRRIEGTRRAEQGLRPQMLDECTHEGPCNNCLRWAVAWRDQMLEDMRRPSGAQQWAQDGLMFDELAS